MPRHAAVPVFLDRDGTLIVEKRYLDDPAGVCLEDSVVAGLLLLQTAGHPLIVISNQSGVGRGFFTEADARAVNARADELLRREGINILAWYICPHTPDAACDCRKPLPGMATAAAHDWNLSLPGSYVIGDKRVDLEFADAIGGTGILLTTGHGLADATWANAAGRPVFDGMNEAARYVRDRERAIRDSGRREQ
jgi:D-glycero-D-manno-heptose 1,7-bisphosphate phosphatase